MWQLIPDNLISHYHEYIADLHYVLVALCIIQTLQIMNSPNVYVEQWTLAGPWDHAKPLLLRQPSAFLEQEKS